MGLFSKLLKSKNMIYSPLNGTVISLAEINDGVFSSGMLGNGCGIQPNEKTVYAPCDGEIIMVADTGHAIGLTSDEGIEIVIHIGLDTVSMKGQGFHSLVKQGDKVVTGQELLTFSNDAIKSAGFSNIVAVLITNSQNYKKIQLVKTGKIYHSEQLIKLE